MKRLKKRKAKFGLDEYEYIGKETGVRYIIRYILNDYVATVEIKDKGRIIAKLQIQNDATRLDCDIRHDDENVSRCMSRLLEEECNEYYNIHKMCETNGDCWKLMEKVVNYVKESESLC